MSRAAVVIFAVVLCGCREPALEYAPPAQSPNFEGYKLAPVRVLNMDDPDVGFHLVRDISPALFSSWRWTGQRPAVRLRVRDNENLKYFIDFALPLVTFKDTGPVTITFLVNDHPVDRVRYTNAGTHHFEKPVPQAWIESYKDATVGAEVDKLWVSKDDGAQFGFILIRIGLTQ